MKKIICLLLCVLLAVSLFGCKGGDAKPENAAGESAPAGGVNLREKLAELTATDEELGLKGTYAALSEIPDGSVDPELVGTWLTADGSTSYTYKEDGAAQAASEYGATNAAFTCITANGRKVLCEEMKMTETDTEGKTTETTALSYSLYAVENDALYFVNVEDTTDENITSAYHSVVTMYRADANGSADAAMAKNAIAPATFEGTWASEKGTFTIEGDALTLNGETFRISVNEKKQLVAEKDGASTAYAVGVSAAKQYEGPGRTNPVETVSLGLYYTGADGNDKPNLLAVLDDWKTEYQWDTYYYSGTFGLQK